MKRSLYGAAFLAYALTASLIGAPAHYDIVNKDLQKIDPSAKLVDRNSSQIQVNTACNRQKNHIIAELRKTKAGTEARKQLLEDQKTIDGACAVLMNPSARKAFHDQIDKEEKERAEKEKQAAEKEKKPEEEKKEKPKESSPGFINDMKSFLAGEFAKLTKDADAKIFNLIGAQLSKINIPSPAFKVFNNDLAMKDMKFLTAPSGPNIRSGLGFTGVTQFNNLAVNAIVYIVQMQDKKIEYSFSIELPDNYKISDMFPSFRKVDVLSLPKGKFVASTFNYTDPQGFSVEKGFNFVASMDLEGPLRALGELRKNASKYDFIVVDMAAPIFLQGVISSTTNVTFKSLIPMRLGIDFTKIKRIPSGFKNVINKILTDDFDISVVIQPTVQTLNAQSGLQIILGTQQTPFRLQALGGVDILSGKINLAAKMPDMLEMQFISIGEVMIEVYVDPAVEAVLALFGAPVSGIGLGGRIDLGKPGDTRASLNAKGKLSLETKKAADFVMEIEGKNIQFAEILSLLTRMAEKSGIKGAAIPASKLPEMTINRIYGKLAPWDTEIAGEKVAAGFQLNLDTQLFGTKFVLDTTIKHKELQFAGSAESSPIEIKVKDKMIMKFAGSGSLGGPKVECNFDAKKPLEGGFKLDTMLDIPIFNLKNKTNLEVSAGAFQASFDTDFLGFTTNFGISVPAKEKLTPEQEKEQQAEFEKRKQEKVAVAQQKVDAAQKNLREVQAIRIAGQQDAIAKAQSALNQAQQELNALVSGYKERKPSRLEQTYVRFGFKGDFQEFLSVQAVPALQQLKQDASAKLAQVDKKIGELSGELEKLRQQQKQAQSAGVSATQKEIDKTRATINRIKAKIKSLRKECDDAPIVKKTYICPKVGTQITAQGSALAAQETYLRGLLKPGKEVIKGSLDVLNKINEATQKASTAIAEAKVFQKTMQGTIGALEKAVDAVGKASSVFKVTEAIGELNAWEISQLKFPKLKSFKAEVNIPGLPSTKVELQDLQFDFKNPKKSALEIATKLVKGIKIG